MKAQEVALEEMKIVQEIIGRQEGMRFNFRTMCLTIIAAAFGLVSLAHFDTSIALLLILGWCVLFAFWLIEVLYHPPFGAAIDRQTMLEKYFRSKFPRSTYAPIPGRSRKTRKYRGPEFSHRLVEAAEGKGRTPRARAWAGIKDGRIWHFYAVAAVLVLIAAAALWSIPRRSDSADPLKTPGQAVILRLAELTAKIQSIDTATQSISTRLDQMDRRMTVDLSDIKASVVKLTSVSRSGGSFLQDVAFLLAQIARFAGLQPAGSGSVLGGGSIAPWADLILKILEGLLPQRTSPPTFSAAPSSSINVTVNNSQTELTEIRSDVEILQMLVQELTEKMEEACRPPAAPNPVHRSNGRLRVRPGR